MNELWNKEMINFKIKINYYIYFNEFTCEINKCVCVVISKPIDSHVDKIVDSNFDLHWVNFELKINYFKKRKTK